MEIGAKWRLFRSSYARAEPHTLDSLDVLYGAGQVFSSRPETRITPRQLCLAAVPLKVFSELPLRANLHKIHSR